MPNTNETIEKNLQKLTNPNLERTLEELPGGLEQYDYTAQVTQIVTHQLHHLPDPAVMQQVAHLTDLIGAFLIG